MLGECELCGEDTSIICLFELHRTGLAGVDDGWMK